MKPILEINNISKQYSISSVRKHRYLSVRDSIIRGIRTAFKKAKTENFWALKDINLDVYPGDTIGIIGRNGAGKSTLLKILSKITRPTSGYINVSGRISSLLEVGTGFHPELSGRENIFLNGSILGLRKKEIVSRLDEIIDFSGVEQFLDTPLKHYSTGMQLRLAFSVAAHLEPDVLVIDEVLAVGDIEFQKKCLGKMEAVSRNEGRTVLFVSHNMGIVKQLCSKGLLLEEGKVIVEDNIDVVIEKYISSITKDSNRQSTISTIKRERAHYGATFIFQKCSLINHKKDVTSDLFYGEPFSIRMEAFSKENISNLIFGVRIESQDGVAIIGPRSSDVGKFYDVTINSTINVDVIFNDLILVPGRYWITLTALFRGSIVDQVSKAISFSVSKATYNSSIMPHSGAWGLFQYNPEWND